MKVIYTQQSLDSLEESIHFLTEDLGIPGDKASEVIKKLLDRADRLVFNPREGQREIYLEHLGKEYRRLIEGHFKIIYLIDEDIIYITDFFDTRQNPEKMKG
jgi:plasmid stabilization system protein ParE